MAMFADLDEESILKFVDLPSISELRREYNLSLIQTLLFDAVEMRVKVEGVF